VGAGCSQQAQQSQQTEQKAAVTIKNFSFNPATLTVKAGTNVTWTNEDSVTHDLTNDAIGDIAEGRLFSLDVEPGKTFSFTFNNTGTYNYHCDIHPSMKGAIVVE
jgi:plastocyanin